MRCPETEVLFSLIRGNAIPSVVSGCSWKKLLELSQTHRLSPYLYFKIKHLQNHENVPENVFAALQKSHAQTLCANILWLQELDNLSELFLREKIPFLVLKGAFLCRDVYAHFSMRPISDLDMLVKEKDFEKAALMLHEDGYRCSPQRAHERCKQTFVKRREAAGESRKEVTYSLDLHWALESFPHVRKETERFFSNVFSRALAFKEGKTKLYGLCPEHNLLYLSLHAGFHHGFSRAVWVLDAALLLNKYGHEMALGELILQTKGTPAELSLLTMLDCAREWFAAPVPEAFVFGKHSLRKKIEKEKPGDEWSKARLYPFYLTPGLLKKALLVKSFLKPRLVKAQQLA